MVLRSSSIQVGSNAADRDRQAAWRQRSVEKIMESRAWRLQHLRKAQSAIQRAIGDYRALDQGQVPWVVVRDEFVRLQRPRRRTQISDDGERDIGHNTSNATQQRRQQEIASRPPLTKLVHRESNALSLYLTAIYVAHMETKAGHTFTNERHNVRNKDERTKSWCRLAGLSAPADVRSRRARMRRALDELETAGLVNLRPPGTRNRYENWVLLSEDGSEATYRVPSERQANAVVLPATFFLNGWHLVLTQGEIAMLLAITDIARRVGNPNEPLHQRLVALPQTVRDEYYGLISGEIYLHAQQLREFELVGFHDPMPNRRRGKIANRVAPVPPPQDSGNNNNELETRRSTSPAPAPYQFSPPAPTVFDRPAFEVIHNALDALPVPYRLSDWTNYVTPSRWVELNADAKKQAPRT